MSAHRLPLHARGLGFSLLEAILAFALILTMAAVVYTTLAPTSQLAEVEQEAHRLDTLRQGVTSGYASAQDFVDLTPQKAMDRGWLGNGSGDGRSTAWGPLTLTAANLGGMPGDGWRLTLADLPGGVCERILASQRGRWTHVAVDGRSADGSAPAGCGTGSQHEVVLEQWGGARPGYALQPLCFDHSRQWVAAHGAPDPTCPSDPAAYGVAKS